jgi:hypothetical protein
MAEDLDWSPCVAFDRAWFKASSSLGPISSRRARGQLAALAAALPGQPEPARRGGRPPRPPARPARVPPAGTRALAA